MKILENKLESMKILENKLESLKLQENQPVDGLEYEIVENHPAEEDQAGNNSPEIETLIYQFEHSAFLDKLELMKILENKLESMKILKNKLESMKILENKLES
ncbi:hypothetical protein Tco_0189107 [Tanacetum coccineum]